MKDQEFKKAEVFTISLAHHLHDIYSSFFAPLLPLLIAKLNMPLSGGALLQITRGVPSLLNPFLALLAEKRGIKYFVILTPAVTAISMSLVGLANSFVMLFILLLVAGISAALFHIPSPVMIKDVSGSRTGTGMSFFMVGGEMARTVGPLLVTTAVSFWSLEEIYRLMPLGILASVILFFKLRHYEFQGKVTKPKEKGDTRKLLKEYRLFFLSLGSFILFKAGIKSALTLYLPVYLMQQGASLWFAGVSLSILQFFGVTGALTSGNISDRIGRKATLLIASAGAITGMGLFIYTQNIVMLSFLGFFMFSSEPVLMAAVQDTETHMPTFMNSMYMSINFGVSSLIVFWVGFFGDRIGLEQTYKICAVFALGMIPAALLLSRYIKKVS